jgi:3-phenylpropionate/cinnamic acid dioxygenase small subunit
MTNTILNTYKTRLEQVHAQHSQMHETSNWTSEMEKTEEILKNKSNWITSRIRNIEEMICYNDGRYTMNDWA